MTMRRLFLLVVLAAACGSPAPAAPPAPTESLEALCHRHYDRERACTAEYMAELVRVRVELDQPPGIAAQDARDGRAALVAVATTEWTERDSQPAVVDPTCAATSQVPAERVADLRARGERCLAMASCQDFAVCAVEGERSYLASGATGPDATHPR